MELCPKCGAMILDTMVCIMPPIYQKQCAKCGKLWVKPKDAKPDTTFNPGDEWEEVN